MRKLGKYNRIDNYESGGKLETICKYNSYVIQNKDQLENNGDQILYQSVLNNLGSSILRQIPKSVLALFFYYLWYYIIEIHKRPKIYVPMNQPEKVYG